MKIERRSAPVREFRAVREDDKPPRLTGYAAVFDSLSEDLGGFRERIAKGAFAAVLGDDVRSLWNHDPNFLLGRTASGTLRLAEDEVGLAIENDMPDTAFARDLGVLIDRGDVREMSFAFTVGDDVWTAEGDEVTRTITRIDRLYDVSPVTFPAYPDTSVAARAFADWCKREGRTAPKIETHDHRCRACGGDFATATDLRRLRLDVLERIR